MHLNVDARDRKSIAVLISTGCLPLEGRSTTFSGAVVIRNGPLWGAAHVAVDRGLCSISPGIQQPRCARKRFTSAFRHAKKPRHSRAGLAFVIRCWETSHTGPMESEAERSICRADSAPETALSGQWPKAARRRWSTSGGEGYAGDALRCAVKTASASEPIFGGDFERSEKRSPDPPPPGATPPRRSLGGSVLQNYAQRQRISQRPCRTLCAPLDLAYRGPFAVHRSIRVR